MNASFLTGIVPSMVTEKVGARKAILFGGLLLTACHILAALMFAGSNSVSSLMLFLIGIVGG